MRATRKKREKKNLFDSDDEEPTPNNQDENKKETNNELDIYDPAKLEENQIYINKETKNKDSLDLDDLEKLQESQRKRQRPKKKKNLFMDSDDDQPKPPSQDENDFDQTSTNLQQKKPPPANLVLSGSEEEEQQDFKEMIQEQSKKEKQVKEVSFQKIVYQFGESVEKRKKLFTRPMETGYKASFYFRRVMSGFTQSYQLLGEDERPLIFCENQRGSIGANYYFSLTKEMEKKNPAYMGKLRGNAAGSTYQLFDCGIQPNKNLDRRQWRTSLAFIDYENNFMGMNGPRKFKVILPTSLNEDIDPFKLAENQTLSMFKSPLVTNFRNKQPRWNERLKSFALNFGGRVKAASIKNFILVDDAISPEEEGTAKNSLVFGKIDDNTFSIEFSSPLSVFQAFAIAVSQFDFKLTCE